MNLHNLNTTNIHPTTWLGWNNRVAANNVCKNPVRMGWNTLPHANSYHVQPTMTGQTGTMGRSTVAAPTKSPLRFQAPVNVYETDCDYTVVCELPGCSTESIDLIFENGTLILKGNVNTLEYPESARHILTEYSVADYYRELTFSSRIVTSEIKADFRHGLLIINLPKQACTHTTATSVAVA